MRTLDRLTLDTAVERRPTVIADLYYADGLTLSFEGKEIVFPRRARPEVEHIFAASTPVVPRELPGTIDENGRLVLVRRLVREGFLQLADAKPGGAAPRRNDGGA
jgi:hypothetical protein